VVWHKFAATKKKSMAENQILDSEIDEIKTKPLNLALLLIEIGGFVGGTTNLINVNISEAYFRQIMGWDFPGIWLAAIFQGVFEGIIYGLIFGFIFTIGFAAITKKKADWEFTKKQLKKIIFVIYGCWIIGGIIAIILAFVFPEDYDLIIHSVPNEKFPRAGYAWVGGSIWGGMIGGIISVIWGLINTNQAWKAELTKE